MQHIFDSVTFICYKLQTRKFIESDFVYLLYSKIFILFYFSIEIKMWAVDA